MASRANKGKEVETSSKGFKRLRKGVTPSSSVPRVHPTRMFEAKSIEEHWLKCFNALKEAKYAPKNWICECHLALELPSIYTVHELELGYVAAETEECNLTLVREFYTNWNTFNGERKKVRAWGQVVCFTARAFNAFLGTLVMDPEIYLLFLEKPPYRDICHILCREHSVTR
ncbi:hypothetical protein HAX54_020180, partial [Datura stramonium]|nr:hypothetical protein [Datura stramonium]